MEGEHSQVALHVPTQSSPSYPYVILELGTRGVDWRPYLCACYTHQHTLYSPHRPQSYFCGVWTATVTFFIRSLATFRASCL